MLLINARNVNYIQNDECVRVCVYIACAVKAKKLPVHLSGSSPHITQQPRRPGSRLGGRKPVLV